MIVDKRLPIINLIFAGCLALYLNPSWAQPESESTQASLDYMLQDSDSGTVKNSLQALQEAQKTMGRYVYDAGEMIDLFFGHDKKDLVVRGSQLDIMLPITLYDDGDINASANFRAQIDLPRTNHRWKLFVASFEQSVDEQPETLSGTGISTVSSSHGGVQENDNSSLGALYNLYSTGNVVVNLDFGINIATLTEFNPFARVKFRQRDSISPALTSRFKQSVFYEMLAANR